MINPIFLNRNDLITESKNKNVKDIGFADIKYSIEPYKRACLVIFIDDNTRELKVLKSKYNLVY